tara:strand:+ start:156 stop:272 length:117 start_codon:yes stop_codon:yes gene_type:complete
MRLGITSRFEEPLGFFVKMMKKTTLKLYMILQQIYLKE